MSDRKSSERESELPELVLPIESRDHGLGPVGARYSLVEFGDYESERSAEVNGVAHELVRELGDDLCFVFRNFPDAKEHPHAMRAAEAAEAADLQGKFWLMHDRLFQHQSELSESLIRRLAEELPIEMEDYDKDLRSGAPARRVAEDIESGEEAGVEATPTLFVNGRLHVGSYEFLPLLEALQGHP